LLLAAADASLYAAKRSGRNRVGHPEERILSGQWSDVNGQLEMIPAQEL
jgi:hypothetical protein